MPTNDTNWTGYAEGRHYATGDRDLARDIRKLARGFAWGETGPLSGPRIGLQDPSMGIHFDVEVRGDGGGSWVLVRSRFGNPFAVVDLFTAPAVARLFAGFEHEELKIAGPETRGVLPAGAAEWPSDLADLGAEGARDAHPRFRRRIFHLPLAVAGVVFAVAVGGTYLSGADLWSTLFPGFFAAGGLALAVGAALLALTTVIYALMPMVIRNTRRRRTDPLLRGEQEPKRGFRQPVEVEPGGAEPEPEMRETTARWRPIPEILRRAVANFGVVGQELWPLAVLAFLPIAGLLWPVSWLIDSTVPSSVAGAALSLGAGLISQILGLVLALPLLGGALALREGRRLACEPHGLASVLAGAVPRLPSFVLAQAGVAGGTLGILLLAALLTGVLPLLAPIWFFGGLVGAAWWNAVHVLSGPVAFLEPEARPMARSRFLTRGLRVWTWSLLFFSAGLAWLARGAVLVAYTALVWRNPLVNWLPDGLMGLGQTLIALVFAALLARMLADAYFNARCLREGLDLQVACGTATLPSAPATSPSRRLAWVATVLVVVGSVFAYEQYGPALAPAIAASSQSAEEAPGSWERHYRDAQQQESSYMLEELRDDILGY
jgi:hypothetical protein